MTSHFKPGDTMPPFGEMHAIGVGLFWARIPMPGPLAWVNCFIFEDPDGWSLVDCGPDTAESRDAWNSLLTGPLSGRRVLRIILTHGHNDHSGLAGYLVSRTQAKLLCTQREYEIARHRAERKDSPDAVAAFLKDLDAAPEDISPMVAQRQQSDSRISRLPSCYTALNHGDYLTLAGESWTVLSTPGHSPAHVALYQPRLGFFLSGDTLLERITPVIGVEYDNPHANPLAAFINTLQLIEGLPAGLTVLPGHGQPFAGAAERAKALIAHHQKRLDGFQSQLPEGTVRDYAMALFARAMNGSHARHALAETLAHLNYLVNEGRLTELSASPRRFVRTE